MEKKGCRGQPSSAAVGDEGGDDALGDALPALQVEVVVVVELAVVAPAGRVVDELEAPAGAGDLDAADGGARDARLQQRGQLPEARPVLSAGAVRDGHRDRRRPLRWLGLWRRGGDGRHDCAAALGQVTKAVGVYVFAQQRRGNAKNGG